MLDCSVCCSKALSACCPACAGEDIEATASFQLFQKTQEALAAEGHKRFPTYAVFQGLRNNMREATLAAPNSFQMLQVRSWHRMPCRLLWDSMYRAAAWQIGPAGLCDSRVLAFCLLMAQGCCMACIPFQRGKPFLARGSAIAHTLPQMLKAMHCMLACPSCTPALPLQAMRCMLPSPSCTSSRQFSELEQEHEDLGYQLSLDEAARLRDSSMWADQEGINHYMQSSVSALDCEADLISDAACTGGLQYTTVGVYEGSNDHGQLSLTFAGAKLRVVMYTSFPCQLVSITSRVIPEQHVLWTYTQMHATCKVLHWHQCCETGG